MSPKERILEYFLDGTFAKFTDDEVCEYLGVKGKEKFQIRKILHDLCESGKLCRDYFFHYGTPEQLGAIKGTVSAHEKGFAFLMPDDKSLPDFFIPPKFLNGAYHRDKVYCLPVSGGRSDDEVEVIKILERGMTEVVGTFYRERSFGFLRPDEKRFSSDIFIPLSDCRDLVSGCKAVAKILTYPNDRAPGGTIIEVLEAENEFFLEELSIIRSYSLREEFPDAVLKAADKQAKRPITQEDIFSRRDFRDALTVTIDGEDTRDIDDAISVSYDGSLYTLGVHIADVSEYVQAKSILDKEAFERGTSVYFPDRVLPMLPPALSNGICSLNEGEERLALSCVMKINKNGKVVDGEIVKSVICSNHRMTYTEVTALINGDGVLREKYGDVYEMIMHAKNLTELLINTRSKKGCVELDVKEKKIILNKDGEIEIPDYERAISHEMIEQFMVTANETVAEYAASLSLPFIYRVHEKPSTEKAGDFKTFLKTLGVNARFTSEEVKPYDYQNILNGLKGKPVYPVVNRVMLRSMMKARYSPENLGHFGLSSTCYCHFTSPIRRYPDLCIHRILKDILDGNYAFASDRYAQFVQDASIQSSETERKVQEAERSVDDLYAVTYMSSKIGEEFDAVISGVTSFGVFAELPNAIEGLIPIDTLPKDDYEYIQEKFTLKGVKNSFTIGEEIKIKVAGCNFDSMRTEFLYLNKIS